MGKYWIQDESWESWAHPPASKPFLGLGPKFLYILVGAELADPGVISIMRLEDNS